MVSRGYGLLIDECDEHSGKLSDWECDFLDSLGGYVRLGGFVSRWQAARLKEIMEKVTGEKQDW